MGSVSQYTQYKSSNSIKGITGSGFVASLHRAMINDVMLVTKHLPFLETWPSIHGVET
jgi:hypothetical protein